MARVLLGDVIKESKNNIDRDNNPYDYYVAGEHMDTEELRIQRCGKFSEPPEPGPAFIRAFKPGQVLYGSRRTYLKKVAVADFEGVCSNTTFVLETKDNSVFLQKLLPFLLYSERFTRFSIDNSKGSTNPYILFSDLAKYEFDLPPLAKQMRLVELFWCINAAKDAYKKLLFSVEALIKSQFIEMFGDPMTNPKGWEVKPLEEVFYITSSKRILKSEWQKNGIPFYRVRDMVLLAKGESANNEFFVSEEFYNTLKDSDGIPKNGDIMVSATSTIGKCYIAKEHDKFYYKDADVLRFRNKGELVPQYFTFSMQMPFIINQIQQSLGATTVGHFTIMNAKKTKIHLPPLSLQNEFAAFVEQADKSKFAAQATLARLEATYKALLNHHLG